MEQAMEVTQSDLSASVETMMWNAQGDGRKPCWQYYTDDGYTLQVEAPFTVHALQRVPYTIAIWKAGHFMSRQLEPTTLACAKRAVVAWCVEQLDM